MAYGKLEIVLDVVGLNGRNNEPVPKRVVVAMLRDVEEETAQEVVDVHAGATISGTGGGEYQYNFTPHPTRLTPRPYAGIVARKER